MGFRKEGSAPRVRNAPTVDFAMSFDHTQLVGCLLAAPPGHWAERTVFCVFDCEGEDGGVFALRLTQAGARSHPVPDALGFPGGAQRVFHGGPLAGLFALVEIDPDLTGRDRFRYLFVADGGTPAPERPFLTGNICLALPGRDLPWAFAAPGATRRIRHFIGGITFPPDEIEAMAADGWRALPARAELLFIGGSHPKDSDLRRLWQTSWAEGWPLDDAQQDG